MSKHSLWIEAAMGMAGDMFSAALIDLGASEKGVIGAMNATGKLLGGVTIDLLHQTLPDGSPAKQINVDAPAREPLSVADAPAILEQALWATGIRGGYAGFAHRALAVLCQAERTAHVIFSTSSMNDSGASLVFIGHAHTPYGDRAPYQPIQDADSPADAFFIELNAPFTDGLKRLDSFSHLFVFSYLERSPGYSLLVHPPWKNKASNCGLFATRSPNRPNPVGLTRTRLRRIEGARIYTDPLDLFDGTPVFDIKPYIQSLDGPPTDFFSDEDPGNDGWLAGSDHLELHRRGTPHKHPGGGQLHEAQDILLDVIGAAWALQSLEVNLERVFCLDPVRVGGGTVDSTSHGRLPVPAPATQAILDAYEIPYEPGPMDAELLTPTGAAILTALSPSFVANKREIPDDDVRMGIGLGKRVFRPAVSNVLRLYCHSPTRSNG